MIFERDMRWEKLGYVIGYLMSFFIFSSVLYIIWSLYKPVTYLFAVLIALSAAFIGKMIRWLLK